MLAVVSVAAFIFLFPVDLVLYAKSLFATALFGANIEFWREAGYFDALADQKPLLHLWSIAVEEQFYLLFPALLLALRGVSPRWRIQESNCRRAHRVIGTEQLGCRGRESRRVLSAADARAWELMLGALLALGVVAAAKFRESRRRFLSRWVSR